MTNKMDASTFFGNVSLKQLLGGLYEFIDPSDITIEQVEKRYDISLDVQTTYKPVPDNVTRRYSSNEPVPKQAERADGRIQSEYRLGITQSESNYLTPFRQQILGELNKSGAKRSIKDLSRLTPSKPQIFHYVDDCSDCTGQGGCGCDNCNGSASIACDSCSGNGTISGKTIQSDRGPCLGCGGMGKVGVNGNYSPCYQCQGTGQRFNEHVVKTTSQCKKCQGSGALPCLQCRATGKVSCSFCEGKGESNYTLTESVKTIISEHVSSDRPELIEKIRMAPEVSLESMAENTHANAYDSPDKQLVTRDKLSTIPMYQFAIKGVKPKIYIVGNASSNLFIGAGFLDDIVQNILLKYREAPAFSAIIESLINCPAISNRNGSAKGLLSSHIVDKVLTYQSDIVKHHNVTLRRQFFKTTMGLAIPTSLFAYIAMGGTGIASYHAGWIIFALFLIGLIGLRSRETGHDWRELGLPYKRTAMIVGLITGVILLQSIEGTNQEMAFQTGLNNVLLLPFILSLSYLLFYKLVKNMPFLANRKKSKANLS